jgi:hypothetical protein
VSSNAPWKQYKILVLEKILKMGTIYHEFLTFCNSAGDEYNTHLQFFEEILKFNHLNPEIFINAFEQTVYYSNIVNSLQVYIMTCTV